MVIEYLDLETETDPNWPFFRWLFSLSSATSLKHVRHLTLVNQVVCDKNVFCAFRACKIKSLEYRTKNSESLMYLPYLPIDFFLRQMSREYFYRYSLISY
jgi:hypothetical protein